MFIKYKIDGNIIASSLSDASVRSIGQDKACLIASKGNPYEVISESEFKSIVNPPKSTDELFTEEMVALNDEYDKNMAILASRYNIAIARDGSSETAKVLSIRAEIAVLDEQYDLDQLAIFNKHYGA